MDSVTARDLGYLESLNEPLAGAAAEMDAAAGAEDIPIVGTAVGRALRVLVRATAARRVVEVGTAIGYSAMWMASALGPDGRIVTIDPDSARTDRARRFWQAAGVAGRIEVRTGEALKILPELTGPFDFAFIDALKHEYAAYLEGILPLLRPGGTVVVDNLLWGGRASGARPDDRDRDTLAIRDFNAAFVRHPALDATILPVGDGLGVGVKR